MSAGIAAGAHLIMNTTIEPKLISKYYNGRLSSKAEASARQEVASVKEVIACAKKVTALFTEVTKVATSTRKTGATLSDHPIAVNARS